MKSEICFPIAAILVSALAVPFIIYFGERRPNYREAVSLMAGVLKFLFVLALFPIVLEKKSYSIEILKIYEGLSIKLLVDPLGLLFALGASFLWILTTLYSVGYMRGTHAIRQTRYFVAFALSLTATMGVAFSGNLLTLFLFYEFMSLITYPLVAHKEDEESLEGARKYVIYLLGTTKLFLIPAMAITYYVAGTLDYAPRGIFTQEMLTNHRLALQIALVLFLYGYNKCSIMPLHSWLPSAMVAPTPVSALLHAVAVVKTGAFSNVRVLLNIFGKEGIVALGLQDFILFITAFTILTGSAIALTRQNFKARLAFSTVSQLSYIVFGIALFHPLSVIGGILHITAHAFSKITLFFSAGSVYVSTHYTEIPQLDGLAKKMPLTFTAFFLASLSMVGIPGFIGFWSKFYLISGSLKAGFFIGALVFLASSFLNAAYFFPIVFRAPRNEPYKPKDLHHYTPYEKIVENYFCAIPLFITALLTLILSANIEILFKLLKLIEVLYVG
ncbi:MAG: proton-conducting transporter membrane subunit [Caldimicrobium sp.]